MSDRRLLSSLSLTLALVACATTPQGTEGGRTLAAARVNTTLGIKYMQAGELEKSRKKLEKAVRLAPGYSGAHEAIAVLYDRVGEVELAEKHYHKSVKLDPKNGNALNNYGQFLCKTGRFAEAEDSFKQAAENPYYRTPWIPQTNAGICFMKVPDYANAEAYLRKALKKQPQYIPALLTMAKLSFDKGNYLSTRAYVTRFQQVSEHTPESLWLAVRTEHALKDHAAWGKYALKLKNDFPDSEQTQLLQEWENEQRSGK